MGKWRSRIKPLLICSLLLCVGGLWGCQPATQPSGEWATVTRVVSGQTLEVLVSGTASNQAERVRLLGIDAPDWQQKPWSLQAKAQLEEWLGNNTPILLESDLEPTRSLPDGSQTRLAYVWRDGVLLNEKLVEAGCALAASRSPNLKYQQRLTQAQEKARLSGIGIWNPDNPMRLTPQEFREQNSATSAP